MKVILQPVLAVLMLTAAPVMTAVQTLPVQAQAADPAVDQDRH